MANFADKVDTINGFVNLGALMRAAGYAGGGVVSSLGIFNPSATTVYLHFTNNGTASSGLTGANGWPIGDSTAAVDTSFYSDRGANMSSIDIGTTWIYCTGIQSIHVIAAGA